MQSVDWLPSCRKTRLMTKALNRILKAVAIVICVCAAQFFIAPYAQKQANEATAAWSTRMSGH